jgi:hypothetical protein
MSQNDNPRNFLMRESQFPGSPDAARNSDPEYCSSGCPRVGFDFKITRPSFAISKPDFRVHEPDIEAVPPHFCSSYSLRIGLRGRPRAGDRARHRDASSRRDSRAFPFKRLRFHGSLSGNPDLLAGFDHRGTCISPNRVFDSSQPGLADPQSR